ncbi:hypothetical protein N7447_009683 [Penicillium robsamsonii]|uniref:uncharacterized protein n=1 Tax=Penicillium robsamsonii TaxID=1792511 RepID=UPI0025481B26|nr:uncharacterized protein N7447_009683 [Penicillium robsamsonii]KAJ5817450.1 hypothetical protein N7447_009683 [Penicillium robsamsonii]
MSRPKNILFAFVSSTGLLLESNRGGNRVPGIQKVDDVNVDMSYRRHQELVDAYWDVTEEQMWEQLEEGLVEAE